MLPDEVEAWPLTDHIARKRQALAVWYGKAAGSWWTLVTLPDQGWEGGGNGS